MNIVLWLVQVILGIKLFTVSHTHGLRQSQPTMQDAIRKMGKAGTFLYYVIAICALVGVVGLILPGVVASATGFPSLTAILLGLMLL